MSELNKNDVVYYARIIPSSGIYDIIELKIRTVEDNWFVGLDKRDKHAYLFQNDAINQTIFIDRKKALKKVKDAESNKKEDISEETFYEEY